MRKKLNKNVKELDNYINIIMEFDTEKRAIYISDNSNNGVAKRYRNKKDIMRIFGKYLYHELNLYPDYDERKKLWIKKKQNKKLMKKTK